MNGATFGPPQGFAATAVDESAFPLLAPDGTAAAPSYSFASEPGAGFTRPATNRIGVNFAGQEYIRFLDGIIVRGSTSYNIAFGAAVTSPDLYLLRQAAGSLGLHNTTSSSAQLSIFNTRTDASNYESLELFASANIFVIRPNAAGSGTARAMHLRFSSSTNAALIVPSSAGSTVEIGFCQSSGTSSALSSGRVNVGNHSITATSGTEVSLSLNASFAPTGTSTLAARCLSITPTINFSNGTPGAGVIQLIRLDPTNTALPTGLNAAIVLSSTAGTLGGIQHFNTSDETTNYEFARVGFNSNTFKTRLIAAGSGTQRHASYEWSNGQEMGIKTATTTITTSSGASQTATNLIPAGCFYLGVTIRVTTTVTGATSIDVGDGSDVDRWGDNIAVSANTTTTMASFTATGSGERQASALSVVLTAVGSNFTGGVVRITVHYLDLTAATS